MQPYISFGTVHQSHSAIPDGNLAESQSCLNLKSCHCLVLVQASQPFPIADEALYCCLGWGVKGKGKGQAEEKNFLTNFNFRFSISTLKSSAVTYQNFVNN